MRRGSDDCAAIARARSSRSRRPRSRGRAVRSCPTSRAATVDPVRARLPLPGDEGVRRLARRDVRPLGPSELANDDRLHDWPVDAVVLHELRKRQLVIGIRVDVDEVGGRTLDHGARAHESRVAAPREIRFGVVEEPHRDERCRLDLSDRRPSSVDQEDEAVVDHPLPVVATRHVVRPVLWSPRHVSTQNSLRKTRATLYPSALIRMSASSARGAL